MNSIQMIKIDKLQPHPDNPRKNVGDVSELADSIRHSGIMQNLTVVPHEGGYRVVIGHRRLAAAKEAGLAELPCVVRPDMSYEEQISTMVSENMQRADLTVPEQVHGIQMLFDLGQSVEQVQKQTGLSRSTVYHRKAMAALPADKLQESWDRGGTLADYVALEQIKDLQVKTNLLKEIGTNNFQNKLENALRLQKRRKIVHDVLILLEPVAKKLQEKPVGSYWKYVYIDGAVIPKILEIVRKIEADKEADYSFYIGESTYSAWMYIYRAGPAPVKVKSEEEVKREKELQELEQRRKALHVLHEGFSTLRKKFITSFRENDADLKRILQMYLTIGTTGYIDQVDIMSKVFGGEGEIKALEEAYKLLCKATPCAVMLASMETEVEKPFDWYGRFEEADEDDFTEAYLQLLASLGYKESDEEKAYWDGTHELFLKEEEE